MATCNVVIDLSHNNANIDVHYQLRGSSPVACAALSLSCVVQSPVNVLITDPHRQDNDDTVPISQRYCRPASAEHPNVSGCRNRFRRQVLQCERSALVVQRQQVRPCTGRCLLD